ncbi:MAG: efflux transporter outer membrane subunit [Prevotella sp.]|nr:efflux transporter outer membrane subunit [Prevotella sp.]
MKMNKSVLYITLATILMSGCKAYHSLYDDYQRPDVKSENVVRNPVDDNAYLSTADSTGFGNLPWRTVFTDANLQTIIEKALANNPDLLNAALNIDMAEAQLKAAKLAFLPSVAFAPQGTISHFGTHSEATKAYTLPISASWNVDLFGNLRSQKKAAQVALLQTKDYELAVKTSLIANAANLYYTLLMLDKQMEIVTEMQKLTKDTWNMMKMQMDLGRTRSTSVQSAEAAYYSVLTQTASLKGQIREVENSLSLLMGEPAHSISRSTLDSQSLPEQYAKGIGLNMLSNRPDVHANEMALAQCFYGVETARSRFYPSITISPTGAYTNSNGLVNPGKILLSVVGQLTQPIFANGQLKAGLRVAEAQYKQAYNTWQNSILSAGSEVSNALVQYNSSDEKSKLEKQQVDVLKKNVEHTELLFRQSSSSYLEVITAQQNLLNAQISKVQDDFSKMQAVVNLYYALGGGR